VSPLTGTSPTIVAAMSSHYTVLGVSPTADATTIRSAYRALARVHHPDAGGDERRMMTINEAWRVLGREEKRRAYDAARRATEERRSKAPATAASPATPTPSTGGPTSAPVRNDGRIVLDFGRFQGWAIEDVAAADDDYLDWLARTPAGRPFSAAIRRVLDERQRAFDAIRPAIKPQRRGWGFR
jgi:curved DNA-binding protein CbpA